MNYKVKSIKWNYEMEKKINEMKLCDEKSSSMKWNYEIKKIIEI